MKAPFKLLVSLACLLSWTACSDPPAAHVTPHLARHVVLESRAAAITYDTANNARLVQQPISDQAWLTIGVANIFRAEVALVGETQVGMTEAQRTLAKAQGIHMPAAASADALRTAHDLIDAQGRAYQYVPLTAKTIVSHDSIPAGSFGVLAKQIVFRPFPDSTGLRYTAHLPMPSVSAAMPWQNLDPRVDYKGSSFAGFVVLAGERAHIPEVAWQAPGELVFDYALRDDLVDARVTLEVRIDDEVLHTAVLQGISKRASVRCALPKSGTGTLTFDVLGDLGAVAIMAPTLTRPKVERPDLAIFLADTFRADNLVSLGSNPAEWAPSMNAFADANWNFQSAWSTASWTLPSQASMMTSLLPLQHGAVLGTLKIDDRHAALAEVLNQAGWQTIAVTEGAYVVPAFGFDQGFERFVVCPPGDLEASLKALDQELDRRDGRPLFLFFQTYRAHTPYVVSEPTLTSHPELFGNRPDPSIWTFSQIINRIVPGGNVEEFVLKNSLNGRAPAVVLEHPELKNYASLYRGGVVDTDRGFQTFLDMLDTKGLRDAGVVLTSDHGESFGELGFLGHGNAVNESCTHVPLIVRPPASFGAEKPQTITAAVSLLDLAPTLLEIADVAAPQVWRGHSLIPLAQAQTQLPDSPVISFECPTRLPYMPHEVSIQNAHNKLILSVDPNLAVLNARAYDLKADPKEAQPLDPDAHAWAQPLIEALNQLLATESKPLYPPNLSNLDASAVEALKALGYVDGD
jgi:arylsulfatase A-like enzyme